MRAVDIDAVVRLARGCADELVFRAEDPGPDLDLSQAERRALLVIAVAVDRVVAQWAGLPARSVEAEAVLMRAMLAALLP